MTDLSLDPEELTRHAAALRRVALAVVKDASAAEDVLQGAYLTALDQQDRSRSLPWLFHVVRSRALDYLRRERARKEHERLGAVHEAAEVREPVSERLETFAVLVKTIASLPENLQEVLYQRYFDGLTPTEIAARRGIPIKTVKTRLSRALFLMREKLGKHFGGEAGGWHGMLLGPLGLEGAGSAAMASKGSSALPTGLLWLSGAALLVVALVPILQRATQGPADASAQTRDASLPIGSKSLEMQAGSPDSVTPGKADSSQAANTQLATNKREQVVAQDGMQVDDEGDDEDLPPESAERLYWCRILDANTGIPVKGATVVTTATNRPLRLQPISLERGSPVIKHKSEWQSPWNETEGSWLGAIAKSDAGGLIQVRISRGFHLPSRATAEGYGPLLFSPPKGCETREEAFDLKLTKPGELEIQLVDEHGLPLPGIRLEAKVRSATLVGRAAPYTRELLHWEGTTQSAGSYVFRGLPSDQTIFVQAWRDDGRVPVASQELRVDAGQKRELLWTLQSGCRVEGFLLDQQDAPYVDTVVWLTSGGANMAPGRDRFYFEDSDGPFLAQASTTDSQGHFVFEHVPPGTWYIGPKPSDSFPPYVRRDGAAPIATAILVTSQTIDRPLTVRAHRGLYISGTIPDQMNSSYCIAVKSEFGASDRFSFPGTFNIGPLELGPHELYAKHGGSRGPTLEVDAPQKDVVLHLAPTGRLSAKWTHPVDRKPCRASILVSQRGARAPASRTTPIAYKLVGTEYNPGTYDIVVVTKDGYVGYRSNLEVRAGMFIENTPVVLELGATLAVEFKSPIELATYAVFHQEVLVACGSIRAGATLLRTVPPGELHVEFRQGDEVVFKQQLILDGGQAGRVAFDQG